jgi:hypothetical protein
MSERDGSTGVRVAVGVILAVLLITGPLGGIDVTEETTALGDGTATVRILESGEREFAITDGRFGTNVSYVRVPDLRLDVESVSGQPRVLYIVRVPALGLDESNSRLLESTGRLRVPLRDQAVRTVSNESYEGRVIVRIQSFSGMETVRNQSIEVRVR